MSGFTELEEHELLWDIYEMVRDSKKSPKGPSYYDLMEEQLEDY